MSTLLDFKNWCGSNDLSDINDIVDKVEEWSKLCRGEKSGEREYCAAVRLLTCRLIMSRWKHGCNHEDNEIKHHLSAVIANLIDVFVVTCSLKTYNDIFNEIMAPILYFVETRSTSRGGLWTTLIDAIVQTENITNETFPYIRSIVNRILFTDNHGYRLSRDWTINAPNFAHLLCLLAFMKRECKVSDEYRINKSNEWIAQGPSDFSAWLLSSERRWLRKRIPVEILASGSSQCCFLLVKSLSVRDFSQLIYPEAGDQPKEEEKMMEDEALFVIDRAPISNGDNSDSGLESSEMEVDDDGDDDENKDGDEENDDDEDEENDDEDDDGDDDEGGAQMEEDDDESTQEDDAEGSEEEESGSEESDDVHGKVMDGDSNTESEETESADEVEKYQTKESNAKEERITVENRGGIDEMSKGEESGEPKDGSKAEKRTNESHSEEDNDEESSEESSDDETESKIDKEIEKEIKRKIDEESDDSEHEEMEVNDEEDEEELQTVFRKDGKKRLQVLASDDSESESNDEGESDESEEITGRSFLHLEASEGEETEESSSDEENEDKSETESGEADNEDENEELTGRSFLYLEASEGEETKSESDSNKEKEEKSDDESEEEEGDAKSGGNSDEENKKDAESKEATAKDASDDEVGVDAVLEKTKNESELSDRDEIPRRCLRSRQTKLQVESKKETPKVPSPRKPRAKRSRADPQICLNVLSSSPVCISSDSDLNSGKSTMEAANENSKSIENRPSKLSMKVEHSVPSHDDSKSDVPTLPEGSRRASSSSSPENRDPEIKKRKTPVKSPMKSREIVSSNESSKVTNVRPPRTRKSSEASNVEAQTMRVTRASARRILNETQNSQNDSNHKESCNISIVNASNASSTRESSKVTRTSQPSQSSPSKDSPRKSLRTSSPAQKDGLTEVKNPHPSPSENTVQAKSSPSSTPNKLKSSQSPGKDLTKMKSPHSSPVKSGIQAKTSPSSTSNKLKSPQSSSSPVSKQKSSQPPEKGLTKGKNAHSSPGKSVAQAKASPSSTSNKLKSPQSSSSPVSKQKDSQSPEKGLTKINSPYSSPGRSSAQVKRSPSSTRDKLDVQRPLVKEIKSTKFSSILSQKPIIQLNKVPADPESPNNLTKSSPSSSTEKRKSPTRTSTSKVSPTVQKDLIGGRDYSNRKSARSRKSVTDDEVETPPKRLRYSLRTSKI